MIAVLQIAILLMSVVIHEVSHGYVADYLGDPTAKNMGRLTLNPIKHLDMWGSLIIPGILALTGSPVVGWAKPVPYNPDNLHKDYKYGPLKVALAGPASNIVLALIFAAVLRLVYALLPPMLIFAFGLIVFINVLLAVFNLIPVPPLDGSKILTIILPHPYSRYVQQIGLVGIFFVFILILYFGPVIFGLAEFVSKLFVGPEVWSSFIDIARSIGLLG